MVSSVEPAKQALTTNSATTMQTAVKPKCAATAHAVSVPTQLSLRQRRSRHLRNHRRHTQCRTHRHQCSHRHSDPFDLDMNLPIDLEDLGDVHFVNTGVPHAVAYVNDLPALDVVKNGAPSATTIISLQTAQTRTSQHSLLTASRSAPTSAVSKAKLSLAVPACVLVHSSTTSSLAHLPQ